MSYARQRPFLVQRGDCPARRRFAVAAGARARSGGPVSLRRGSFRAAGWEAGATGGAGTTGGVASPLSPDGGSVSRPGRAASGARVLLSVGRVRFVGVRAPLRAVRRGV